MTGQRGAPVNLDFELCFHNHIWYNAWSRTEVPEGEQFGGSIPWCLVMCSFFVPKQSFFLMNSSQSFFFFLHSMCIEVTHSKQCQEVLWQEKKLFLVRECCWNSVFATGRLSCSLLPFWRPHQTAKWLLLVLAQGTVTHSRFAEPCFLTAFVPKLALVWSVATGSQEVPL